MEFTPWKIISNERVRGILAIRLVRRKSKIARFLLCFITGTFPSLEGGLGSSHSSEVWIKGLRSRREESECDASVQCRVSTNIPVIFFHPPGQVVLFCLICQIYRISNRQPLCFVQVGTVETITPSVQSVASPHTSVEGLLVRRGWRKGWRVDMFDHKQRSPDARRFVWNRPSVRSVIYIITVGSRSFCLWAVYTIMSFFLYYYWLCTWWLMR
jgi:hypothetical protein